MHSKPEYEEFPYFVLLRFHKGDRKDADTDSSPTLEYTASCTRTSCKLANFNLCIDAVYKPKENTNDSCTSMPTLSKWLSFPTSRRIVGEFHASSHRAIFLSHDAHPFPLHGVPG